MPSGGAGAIFLSAAIFSKILIANRGEIACRIIRTARRLGIATVAVYSSADRDALHVASADEAFEIGPAPARESYLNGARIIDAARLSGAEAIHPGYGFLSENAPFAAACTDAGLVFIGPPPSAIWAMGDKSQAKALMEKAGVPLAPGYHGEDQDEGRLLREAARIGYPALIKAAAGGGGKGMKIAAAEGEFRAQLASARREAAAAFGDSRVLLEKYLPRARHVEVQIFADAHQNCVHLFDRDCSIQRRHQKIIEEAPAPGLSAALRQRMGRAAVAAARAVGYVGAGTVEFLVPQRSADGDEAEEFFFMEMNTRLQVEHPVTEMITGLDLVEWQIDMAAGAPLPLRQEEISQAGCAMEARLYAEDPRRDFLPQAGRLERLDFPPLRPHLRIDEGYRSGDEITIDYDPLIAKLIVFAEDRPTAAARLADALGAARIIGPPTNLEFLHSIAANSAFRAAEIDIGFIARHEAEIFAQKNPASPEIFAIAVLGLLAEREAGQGPGAGPGAGRGARQDEVASADPFSPWARRDSWRLNETVEEKFRLREIGAAEAGEGAIMVEHWREGWRLRLPNGALLPGSAKLAADGALAVDLGGRKRAAFWIRARGLIHLFVKDEPARRFAVANPFAGATRPGGDSGAIDAALRSDISSPMPGRIIAFLVEAGAEVEANQPIIIIEAMKMEHTLRAPRGGVVKAYGFAVGDRIGEGEKLATIEPFADSARDF